MKNKRVLPALLGSVALTLGLVTVSTSINKEVVNAAEEVIDFGNAGLADKTVLSSHTFGDMLFKGEKGSHTNTSPTYYTSGTAIRIYQGNNFSISVGDLFEISSLTFTFVSEQYAMDANDFITSGYYVDNTFTLSTPTNIVEMKNGNAENVQIRIKTITVTYDIATSYAEKNEKTIEKYYNSGTYTKKSEIRLNDAAITDMQKYFHGDVQKDRTTYYTKENGRDALFMADLNGEFKSINSGYSTVTEANRDKVKSDLKNNSIVDGYMAHYKYVDGVAKYDYFVAKQNGNTLTTGIQQFYVTLDDMLEEDYFASWTSNQYKVTGRDDKYLLDFLAFAAPCLEDTILDTEYIFVDDIVLEISEGTNLNNALDYLSLKILLGSGDYGKVGNGTNPDDLVMAEARIYSGNKQFDESVMSEEVISTNKALAQDALNSIEVPNIVSYDFKLGEESIDGVKIAWESDNDAIIFNGTSATVTKGSTDVLVNVTATATINGVSVTQTYQITVEKIAETQEEITSTISFSSTAQRESQNNNQQVWKNEGVTFTNNKASSSNSIGNYSNPVRLYQGTEVIIEANSMTKIVIESDGTTKYKNALEDSLKGAGINYSNSGNNYTIELETGVNSLKFSLTAQARFKSISVTYLWN